MKNTRTKIFCVGTLLVAPLAASAFSFDTNSYYTSFGATQIAQRAYDGTLLGTISPTGGGSLGTEMHGLAFGGDGLLYAVRTNQRDDLGASIGNAGVDAINASGEVVRTYSLSGQVTGGGGGYGAGGIAFSNDGSAFYVGATDGIYQFNVNGSTGSRISTLSGNDIAVMPNGNLLVATGDSVAQLSSTGSVIGTLSGTINDPQKLFPPVNGMPVDPHTTQPSALSLHDVKGVAFDAASNTTYVAVGGDISGAANSKVLALAGFSNTLKAYNGAAWLNDLYMANPQTLLVGVVASGSGVSFTADLAERTFIYSGEYVTAMTSVPEAGSLAMMSLGLVGLLGASRRGRRS